ncbi:MAG: hypothetical protein PVJ57_10050 [Phycisphaerae bacterium]|jgi:hypothetical protein
MMMSRSRKMLWALATGAVTFGWLQAWEMTNFSDFWTQFITQFLNALITALFGGDYSTLLA